ncbi:MAG: PD-(D/E)XK nuclease family protein, partial [Methyloligellaceae bacterium]
GALEVLDTAKAARRRAELEESHRLLYVAMTRARDRLYVCGYEGRRSRDQGCWYDLIFDGVKGLARETIDDDGRSVWRLESAQQRAPAPDAAPPGADREPPPLPDWVGQAAAPERPSALTVTPSTVTALEGAEREGALEEQSVLPPAELADQSRFLRGSIVHALLEHLPEIDPAAWDEIARRFVALRGAGLDEPMREEIVAETLSITRDPAFAHLFGADSRAEVPIVARLPVDDPKAVPLDVSGQIDRLVILEQDVWIVDYKTNRPPPTQPEDVAPGYLAQLAAYRAAIRLLYGHKAVRCALLWTAAPRIMEIPASALDVYEARIHALGAGALDGHQCET